jgi:hypothetical protein
MLVHRQPSALTAHVNTYKSTQEIQGLKGHVLQQKQEVYLLFYFGPIPVETSRLWLHLSVKLHFQGKFCLREEITEEGGEEECQGGGGGGA